MLNVRVIIYHCIVDRQTFRFPKLVESGVKNIQVPCSVKKTQWVPFCTNMRLQDGAETSTWAISVWDLKHLCEV